MSFLFIDYIGALIDYLIIYLFFRLLFYPKPSLRFLHRPCHILMPLLLFVLTEKSVSSMPQIIGLIICNILLLFLFEGPLTYRIFAICLYQLSRMLFAFSIYFILIPDGVPYDATVISLRPTNVILQILTLSILASILTIHRKHSMSTMDVPKRELHFMMAIPVFVLLLAATAQYLLYRLDQPALNLLGIPLTLCCAALNLMIYALFRKFSTGETAKKQLSVLERQITYQDHFQDHILQSQKNIQTMSHDMKRHLSNIYQLLLDGQTQKAMRLLETHQLEISKNTGLITGYPLIDAVLNYQNDCCVAQHIAFTQFWSLSETIYPDCADLAVLLSNALENAREACATNEEDSFITLSVNNDADFIHMAVTNSLFDCGSTSTDTMHTTKPDKLHHGHGLFSIRAIAEKYGGSVQCLPHNQLFTLKIDLENRIQSSPCDFLNLCILKQKL